MRTILKYFFILALSSWAGTPYALATKEASSIRLGIHEDKTRLVVDLNQSTPFKVIPTNSDKKFQVKILNVRAPKNILNKQKGKGFVTSYDLKQSPQNTLTLTIETGSPSQIVKAYVMDKSQSKSYKLVIDVAPLKTTTKAAMSNIPMPFIKPLRRTVVIDAGHGGHDPGTTSPLGYLEKDITLAVAIEMKKIIDKAGKYTAVLTRTKDQHLPLRYRFSVAREMNANLLISLHADSNPNKNVKGVSVYTLSEKASDKEAQRLADKENAADFLDDLKFTHDEQDVKDILINLSQTRAKNHSIEFADILMKRFDRQDVLQKNSHRSAGFAVLKAPDVASVLIELGYLSNVKDEKRLVSKQYQRKIASLIVNAIDDYFEHVKS